MRRGIQKKIEHWRSLPEDARLRKVSQLTWGAGIFLVALWGVALLPLQLYIQRHERRQPAVEGANTVQPSPTPTTSPSTSMVPSPTIELQK